MVEYKYFVHRDAQGKVIGWDMGPVFMTIEDHEKANPGKKFTTEVSKDEFEKEVAFYKEKEKGI